MAAVGRAVIYSHSEWTQNGKTVDYTPISLDEALAGAAKRRARFC